MRAPDGPLKAVALHDVLAHRRRLSGLDLPRFGPHALRHSLAVHLLRQGVGIKTIGDTLGHRHIESTFSYLRLGVEELRGVALPAPPPLAPGPCRPLVPRRNLPPTGGAATPTAPAQALSERAGRLPATLPGPHTHPRAPLS